MRVSNETKVGALTIIAVCLMILGFNFLKGKTFFKSGTLIYAKYADTKGLIVSNPVFVNGFQVGTVFEIENLNNNLSELVVCIKLNQLYKIPKNSIATIQENPLGTNAINIIQGNSSLMIVSGDTIQSAPATSLLGDLMNELSPVGDQVKNTIRSLELVLNILTNLDSTTKSINDADLYKTIKTIQTTLIALNTTINQLNNGNGTASKLLNDPAMYTQLQSTVKSVNTLVDDIKVHPKRYISISVFGKKDKRTPLTKPLSDTLDHE